MRISKGQISVLYVVFVLAAGGLVCGAVCNRATVTEQLTDKDVLGWKLEKMFFTPSLLNQILKSLVDPEESRIIDDLIADLHAGRFDVVVSKAEPYMRESSHSWNFYFALGAIMIDCKNYRLAQQAFALSERKLTGLIPDAYPSQNFLKRGLNLDPRQALTEAYIHELQDLK
ncbi:MAG: hypothetical protein IPP57_12195 [Candidatus Obscuribacter sp.]|nr:hypothetical protein [Candidatus Obscuribacter sp.]